MKKKNAATVECHGKLAFPSLTKLYNTSIIIILKAAFFFFNNNSHNSILREMYNRNIQTILNFLKQKSFQKQVGVNLRQIFRERREALSIQWEVQVRKNNIVSQHKNKSYNEIRANSIAVIQI